MTLYKILPELFLLLTNLIVAQTELRYTDEYIKGKEALSKKDTLEAVELFNKSIMLNHDSPSYYELAGIRSLSKSNVILTEALNDIRKALEGNTQNIEYKLLMAKIREKLYHASKLNLEERPAAIKEYKEILVIDSVNVEALFNLGRLKTEDFLKSHNSAAKGSANKALNPTQKMLMLRKRSTLTYDKMNEFNNTRGVFLSFSNEEDAKKDLREAEGYLMNALKYAPDSEKFFCELSKLFIYNNTPEKAIPIWDSFKSNSTRSKNSHLYRGVLFYMTRQFEKCTKEFTSALEEMKKQEKEDYTLNSVCMMLEPKLGGRLSIMTKKELTNYISQFWEINDPLNLTEENERLLEHYYRVAYSNMFFGNDDLNLTGWKSDRGEILVRYGQPVSKVRYVQETPDTVGYSRPMTEIWDYEEMSFAFVDPIRNNQFTYGQPWNSMIPMNTHDEVINLRKEEFEKYNPTFAGPVFSVPYQTFQFRSIRNIGSDIYVSFSLNFADSSTLKEKFDEGYEVGLCFFDKYFNKVLSETRNFSSPNSKGAVVNSIPMKAYPDSGSLAFEIIRKKDKGVASYHGKFVTKDFRGEKLMMSDIVCAANVEFDKTVDGAIQRNNISILPNLTKSYSKDNPFYIYYELYNLKKGQSNTTDFEQKLTIQRKGEDGILTNLLNAVGFDRSGDKISLSSRYQTQERDPQMYLQLDMNRYESGNYIIKVLVKDNVNSNETENETEISWHNE